MTEEEHAELDRLLNRGLNIVVALKVMAGTLDEEFEVEWQTNSRAATDWVKLEANRETRQKPIWDFEPSRYYLSLDGRKDLNPNSIFVLDADVADVFASLHRGSTRSESRGPWHHEHKSKSGHIAYRWSKGAAVTPPMIVMCEGRIALAGGYHRFYLAAHFGEERIPLLANIKDRTAILALLRTARARETPATPGGP